MRTIPLRIGILLACALASAHGQWLNHPSPGTPRTRDGKPNLAAAAPRAKGHPDLSGVWQIEPESKRMAVAFAKLSVPGDDSRTFSRFFFDVTADFKPGEAPTRPEADALFHQRAATFGRENPAARCLPLGLPSPLLLAVPFKIVQTPGITLILQEADNSHRQIYTDGRPLPVDPQPAWRGYSVGKWEGDTLVVDTAGFNDESWLDAAGHPHSESLRLQERFHRRDFGHLDVSVTIDDPKTFTRPFTIQFSELLVPDSDILEAVCAENENDRSHLR